MGNDLLLAIKDYRTQGKTYDGFNSKFIALIPKTDHPNSFKDYRPISLCNCFYKIISKIIANRIKPILSFHIAKEKFAFLHHKHIREAFGMAQEALHSIKSKNLKATILKIDLAKAFDRVNWSYLHFILIQTGFPPTFINWIMGCICHASFGILINGTASDFFHAGRGLRQGCPLPPLLFVFVMEGLSTLIKKDKTDGDIHGLHINDLLHLTRLLFIDDVLILNLDGSCQDTIQ